MFKENEVITKGYKHENRLLCVYVTAVCCCVEAVLAEHYILGYKKKEKTKETEENENNEKSGPRRYAIGERCLRLGGPISSSISIGMIIIDISSSSSSCCCCLLRYRCLCVGCPCRAARGRRRGAGSRPSWSCL